MSLHSGVGTKVAHSDGTTVYDILYGLANGSQTVTIDGLPFGPESHALEHIINFFRSILPSTITLSNVFPREVYDSEGNILGNLKLPYVAIRGMKGPSREVGVGGVLADPPEGVVMAYNQIMYFEFDIFHTTNMKVTQIVDQIILQLQKQKRYGGILHAQGFQDFIVVESESNRGFRYDTAWDYKMQHQYTELFHTRLTVRTMFDVAWLDRSASEGIISMIVFSQTVDIPFETFIGASLEYLRLEELYWDWHGGTLL